MGGREVYAFPDKPSSDTKASCRWFDKKKSQLGNFVRLVNEKHASDSLSFTLSDPAALTIGIEIPDEVLRDFIHQILKTMIPSVFPGVDIAMTPYHPLDVVVTMLAKSKGIRHAGKFARVRAIREY